MLSTALAITNGESAGRLYEALMQMCTGRQSKSPDNDNLHTKTSTRPDPSQSTITETLDDDTAPSWIHILAKTDALDDPTVYKAITEALDAHKGLQTKSQSMQNAYLGEKSRSDHLELALTNAEEDKATVKKWATTATENTHALAKKNTVLNADIHKLRNAITLLRDANNDLARKVEVSAEEKDRAQQLEGELANLQAAYGEGQDANKDLKKLCQTLHAEKKALERELGRKNLEVRDLKGEIKRMKSYHPILATARKAVAGLAEEEHEEEVEREAAEATEQEGVEGEDEWEVVEEN